MSNTYLTNKELRTFQDKVFDDASKNGRNSAAWTLFPENLEFLQYINDKLFASKNAPPPRYLYTVKIDPGISSPIVNCLFQIHLNGKLFEADFEKASIFVDSVVASIAAFYQISYVPGQYHPYQPEVEIDTNPIGKEDSKIPGAFFSSLYDWKENPIPEGKIFTSANGITFKKVNVGGNLFVPNYRWITQA